MVPNLVIGQRAATRFLTVFPSVFWGILLQNAPVKSGKNAIFFGVGAVMRTISAAAIAMLMGAAMSAPAVAQGTAGMADKESPMQRIEKQKEEERKAIEKDYDKTMQRLKKEGAAATSNDPWATVRPVAAEPKKETKNEPKKRQEKQ